MGNLIGISNLAFLGYYLIFECLFYFIFCHYKNEDIPLNKLFKGFIGSLLLLFFL